MSFLLPTTRVPPSRTAAAAPFRLCAHCRRTFASGAVLRSGHNRWSKIRHEKGAADQKKTAQRMTFAKNLTLYSKLYGPDPNLNGSLAAVIAAAKKAGMPKANIDVAIARGQGRSSTGAGLESAILEVMVPAPSPVALVVAIESDNKQRSLKDLRHVVKKHGAAVTPTAFLFERRGRSVLRARPKGGPRVDFDDVLMRALAAGADDVVERDDDDAEGEERGARGGGEDGAGRSKDVVLWTQPNMTHQVAQKLAEELGMEIVGSDIIWSAVATTDKVGLDDEEATRALGALLAALRDYPDVQAIYANAEKGAVSDEVWGAVEENLDS
ncbi:transcriptional regulator TACO1-like protein [Biscogniauxia marginata]|nr:transcriptional regulator TACO1-like protein [Biscogniauxia marginata]